MYVANTHLKPVIGIDIHFVNLPFPFIPIPHPYIGLVIDPFDYIPFIGATVKVNNVPRGNTDTAGMIITFVHIPFGAGFTIFPVIGHDSQNFFGSKTVSVDGAPMSGAGYMLMTCNDIGLPLSFRPGKKFIPIPSLYLPTSFCIPLQWGKPVMVGGPLVPNFSLMALLKAFALGSALKILGKVGGKLLKALNHSVLKKSPSTKKLSNMFCKMGFEPVDLISGRVNYEYTDFELPGPIPIKWTRNWDSDSSINGPLGHGTQLCYDRAVKVWSDPECVTVTLADGRLAVFPLLQPGDEYYHPQEKILLRRKQNGHFILEDYNEALYFHFNLHQQPGTWKLSFIENYSGHRIQLHYTGGNLSAITDSAGRQLLFDLDKHHRITGVQVKHKSTQQTLVNYAYNDNNDLIEIKDALDQVTTIEYRYHLMIKKTDRNGQSFYWEYDSKKRCIHTWGNGGILEGFMEYRKGYNVVTNSLGETTTYYFDENNLCVQETDHYGNHRYTEYTDEGDLYREIDEEGNITGFVYDDRNLIKEKIMPDGGIFQFHYNEQNQPVLEINPDGSSTTYGYDALRRIQFINQPNGNTKALEYNEDGQLETIVETGNRKTTLLYDEDANLVKVQLSDNTTAIWKYDDLGRIIQTTNTTGEQRYYEYDALNRVRQLHVPDGNTIHFEYNAYEQITRVADLTGEVKYEYTPMGNLTSRKQNNGELRLFYDTEERLRTVTNEAGRHYSFAYNKRGELIRETGYDGIQWQYERDVTGKVIKTIRPGGRFTNYEYDANGRIIRIEYHDGTRELFSYDKNGKLQEASNEHSTVRFTRNKLGYIETEEQDGYIVQSNYDKTGNRIHITSNLGADIHWNHNKLGLVTEMQGRQSTGALWEAKLKYNEAGIEKERTLPGELTSEWVFDEAGRPGEHKISRRGVVESWKKYTWDADERLANIFDTLSQTSTRFRHDAAGNLVFAQYADNKIIHRTTDASGNIYETAAGTERKYNAAGALLESEKYLYKYDEEGNLISKTDKTTQKKHRYEWYANGLLKKVMRPDKKEVRFTYDALGRRLSKSYAGKITRWVWDNNVPLHEWSYDAKQQPVPVVNEWGDITYDREEPNPLNITEGHKGITWLFEPDNFVPVAKIENDAVFSILGNHIGTPQWMFDATGKKVWEGVTDIYGRIHTLQGNKSDLPFRDQGQYEDVETGLYYNRFRYYAPEEGLYISQDPLGLFGNNATLYAYVRDAHIFVDLFGLQEGGSYGATRKSQTGGQTNHMPAFDASSKGGSGITHYSSPATHMDTPDHQRGASWGSRNTSKEWRSQQEDLIKKGKFGKAMEMDIRDTKRKFGTKYDRGMKEMIDYSIEKGHITRAEGNRFKRKYISCK